VAVDKKKARLNCISHLLSQVSVEDVPHEPVVLPERVHNPNYIRGPPPRDMFVPARY
jgi:polyphosphate kinase